MKIKANSKICQLSDDNLEEKEIFSTSYEPNEKTAKILLNKNNYSKGFENLEDLFENLEKEELNA